MNSNLTCPECGHTQPAPNSLLGRKVRCPSCRAVFRVTASELKPAVQPRSDEYPLEPAAPSPPHSERRREVAPAAPV